MANVNQQEFEIFVSDYSSSVEEWKRALEAPASKLPKLTRSQREVARKFGISSEEYARGVLTGQYGEDRLHGRALRLGGIVTEILTGLGPDHKLEAVIAEMVKTRWLLRVRTPTGVVPVQVPRELADDVLDSGAKEEIEKLRVRLLSGLNCKEFIGRG